MLTARQTIQRVVRACLPDQDRQVAGVEIRPDPPVFRYGTPLLALVVLAAAVVAAFLGSGGGPGWTALALVAVAAVPWVQWLLGGDRGPTVSFVVVALAPVAALGAGQAFSAAFALGGDLPYLLVTFPVLLTVLLVVGFAAVPMAVGATVAAYGSVAVPLIGGLALGRATVDGTGTVMWHIAFALCVAAGYGVNLSYRSSRALGKARVALARQEAAEERRRIAQDVHDVVAHTLAITMLHVTAARMAVRRSSPRDAEEALEEAERHGRASLADIRRIVRLLRSEDATSLDGPQPGLADVEALAGSYRAAGLGVELSLAVDGQRTSPTAELAVYRILQEALANAARHGSGPATVELRVTGGALSLRVDNPVRADHPAERTAATSGSGLLGMRERVSAAGGTISTGAQDGRWVVRATVPGEAGA